MPTIEFDPNTGKRLTAGQSVVFGGRSYKQGSTEVGGTALPLLPPEDKSKLANTDNTISNLGNFRTVLRSALNEATNLRAQSSLKQLAPLSEGAPGGMKFLADALKTMEIRPSAETAFSDAMEARKDEIARLREETKCTLRAAYHALSLREGILEFAIEYIERRDIPESMSQERRYPRWSQYLHEKKKYAATK